MTIPWSLIFVADEYDAYNDSRRVASRLLDMVECHLVTRTKRNAVAYIQRMHHSRGGTRY